MGKAKLHDGRGMVMCRATLCATIVLAARPALGQDGAAMREPDVEAARTYFRIAFAGPCSGSFGGVVDGMEPQAYVLPLEPAYSTDDPGDAILYGFACSAGAYNVTTVWVIDVGDRAFGLAPVSFPEPVTSFEYADEEQTRLATYEMSGFTSANELFNATFDPQTLTMRSLGLSRGMGDAWSAGTWRFQDGRFVLERYEVDPTFDGDGEGGIVVYDATGD